MADGEDIKWLMAYYSRMHTTTIVTLPLKLNRSTISICESRIHTQVTQIPIFYTK